MSKPWFVVSADGVDRLGQHRCRTGEDEADALGDGDPEVGEERRDDRLQSAFVRHGDSTLRPVTNWDGDEYQKRFDDLAAYGCRRARRGRLRHAVLAELGARRWLRHRTGRHRTGARVASTWSAPMSTRRCSPTARKRAPRSTGSSPTWPTSTSAARSTSSSWPATCRSSRHAGTHAALVAGVCPPRRPDGCARRRVLTRPRLRNRRLRRRTATRPASPSPSASPPGPASPSRRRDYAVSVHRELLTGSVSH